MNRNKKNSQKKVNFLQTTLEVFFWNAFLTNSMTFICQMPNSSRSYKVPLNVFLDILNAVSETIPKVFTQKPQKVRNFLLSFESFCSIFESKGTYALQSKKFSNCRMQFNPLNKLLLRGLRISRSMSESVKKTCSFQEQNLSA